MPWKIFLSYEEEDRGTVDVFLQHIKDSYPDLEFVNYKIKEPFESPQALDTQADIRELLETVSTTLVLIGRTTYADKWVDWEVRTSSDMGKNLLGVRLHGELDHIIPRALKDLSVEVCDLNVKHIAETIEGEARRRDMYLSDTG